MNRGDFTDQYGGGLSFDDVYFRPVEPAEEMATPAVRAAAASSGHHRQEDGQIGGAARGLKTRRSRSRSSSNPRPLAAVREATTERDDVFKTPSPVPKVDSNTGNSRSPTLTSTPIDGNLPRGRHSRFRSRTNSGESTGSTSSVQSIPRSGRPSNLSVSHIPSDSPGPSNLVVEGPLGENQAHGATAAAAEGPHLEEADLNASMSSSTQTMDADVDMELQVQAPIVGYEIMEERARFTVSFFKYRIKVHVIQSNGKIKKGPIV